MLAEKYFPKGSARYDFISNLFRNFDWLNTLKPERWFGVWTMVLAGSNVSIFLLNRWSYWDWSTFNFIILGILLLVTLLISLNQSILLYSNTLQSNLIMFVKGILLFSFGAIPFGFNINIFLFGLPYFLFFNVGFMTWSIDIDSDNNKIPSKKEMIPTLLLIILLTFSSSYLGYLNDDPMISTIAAVYIFFPMVVLFFPVAIRHIQRSRMHVIFIPAMFISVRFPWFLVMVLSLFWILRHYNYFTIGEVIPSFKVNLPSNKNK